MPAAKKRGRVIHYDQVPDKVYNFILDQQVRISKEKGFRVSMATTITQLLKSLIPTEKPAAT